MNIKRWNIAPLDKDRAAQMAEEYQIPFFLAMLLEIRGLRTREQIQEMLQGQARRCDPLSFADMQKAVDRIRKAVDAFEPIAIYGDYDADGVTATALLYSYLESCGANVMFYIPERELEGYGMNRQAIDQLHAQGIRLIVTVDNGIASVEETAYANELGIDVVITDHHRPLDTLPDAVAVVDPHRADCPSPFKDFSGVGVAFQLVAALEGEESDWESLLDNYADFVAIGTIGDVVPLLGENRAFVRRGLRLLSRSDRVGIAALLQHCALQEKELTATNVAFGIVPRINAAGRMGSSQRAVHLLTCEDPEFAESLAADICDSNTLRREIEAEILEKAVRQLEDKPGWLYQRVLITEGDGWHPGVLGIVAARLVERYGRPCVVLSRQGEEAVGSGRSVEGFSLFEAVCSCAPLLTKFGGHPMAAGMSMRAQDIGAFRQAMYEYAARFPQMPAPTVELDCKLNPGALQKEMAEQMRYLEPFGTGNPAPVFGLYEMCLQGIVPVGGGKHLRLEFRKKDARVTCMKFGVTAEQFPYEPGDVLDLAVQLECREFRGQESLTVLLKDMRLSHMDPGKLLADQEGYDKYKRGDPLSDEERQRLLPSREDFAAVYRMLKSREGWRSHLLSLLYRLRAAKIPLSRLRVVLDVLEEHGLITQEKQGEIFRIRLLPTTQKVDLFDSKLLSAIETSGERGCRHEACAGKNENV